MGKGAAELRGPTVTLPELFSLAVARDFLAPLAGTFYWRGIAQLMARLQRVVTPELMEYVDQHKEGLVVHPRPTRVKYAAPTLNAVNRAIRKRLELAIGYTSLAKDKAKTYTIRPEALVLYDGSLYIAATRADRGADDAVRFFKLDRVTKAKATAKSFEPQGEAVESLLTDSITIFRGAGEPQRYRLRIAPERATWAQEKPFHPGQQARLEPDGSLLLTIERAWDDEMIPQLLALVSMSKCSSRKARERLLEMRTNCGTIRLPAHQRVRCDLRRQLTPGVPLPNALVLDRSLYRVCPRPEGDRCEKRDACGGAPPRSFSGVAIMPTTLIIEGMAQTGGILAADAIDYKKQVVLAKVSAADFDFDVVPGDTIEYRAATHADDGRRGVVKVTTHVGGRDHGEAELFFAHLETGKVVPRLFKTDEMHAWLDNLRIYDVAINPDGTPVERGTGD